jgi:ankyrin repeat protein
MQSIVNFNEVFIQNECCELIEAAADGDIERLRHLLEFGVSPDIRDHTGWTALRRAALNNRCEEAAELLKHGAVVDAANYFGQTAMMVACAHGNHEFVSLLLSFGADPNRANLSGHTALMIAAEHGFALVVDVLLAKSHFLDVGKTDPFGKDAFQLASENHHDVIVGMLIAAGEDIVDNDSGKRSAKNLVNSHFLNFI